MSGMVCYFERFAGGSALRRVRLVGAAFDRSWTAPGASGEVVSGAGSGSGGAAVVSGIRAGAKWVAETLKSLGAQRLDVLVLDAEGGMCAWLSAPSADQRMVGAAIQQAVLGGGEGAGGSAGRLIATGISTGDSSGLDGGTSFQALAVADPAGRAGGSTLRWPGRRSAAGIGEQRERFGVISVRDASARIFLDELDTRGIEIGTVESTWHAISAAWDPAAPRPGEEPAADPQTCAVVMTDPAGRIVWAWSRAGELIAAGTVRLRQIVQRHPVPPPPAGDAGAIVEAAAAGATARRLDEDEPAEQVSLECTGAEVGRLVMDWLAWSAQLGHAPDRVVCIGPSTSPGEPAASAAVAEGTPAVPGVALGGWLGGPTPASLAEGLGRAWPGATIDAAVHEDPIGGTLARLAGVGPIGARPDTAGLVDDDPRRELVSLSARPGRADRWMYRWMTVGLLAASAAVVVVGWQFHRSAAQARASIAGSSDKRIELLKSMDTLIPGISAVPDPGVAIGRISGKVGELEQINKSLRLQRPIMAELERVLVALEGVESVRLTELQMNAAVGTVKLKVPDSEAGPAILDKIVATPFLGCMPWVGRTPPLTGEDRFYVLTGSWPTESQSGGKP